MVNQTPGSLRILPTNLTCTRISAVIPNGIDKTHLLNYLLCPAKHFQKRIRQSFISGFFIFGQKCAHCKNG